MTMNPYLAGLDLVRRMLGGARRCALILLGLAASGLTAWGALALGYLLQDHPAWRWAVVPAWTVLGFVAAVQLLRSRSRGTGAVPVVLYACAVLALLAAWSLQRPSHQRLWADDVARLLRAQVHGNRVELENVRNFDWRSETDYTPRWERRSYDLDRLTGADLILSYWMGPQIAHTLVSFEFDDGQRVVFSLEIRKERHESFSAIGGFFRQFEQVLVAADERDIVRTRSNARGEDVYLYRMQADPSQLRQLFLNYVEAANDIERSPRFYNTLTSNCTTIVFDLARLIAPGLPADYRLLLSGHFAEYVYDQKALTPGYSYQELQQAGHINARAKQADASGQDFSLTIREGVPGALARKAQP
ncbi:Lnb N-terminal periplasmic domain-containing protein [Paraburkholderia adhaesiva]|uniref:Lnb N-terminal periplasmic domain-containing protein n=1 Tax=Paraburkholderia adhaesiva TaxID=2883244 RepID=UPI004032C3F8